MLGSGEFVMLLLRCCLLLMRWLLVLLLLLRPRGRTGARPMGAASPSLGTNSIVSSRRNVLLVSSSPPSVLRRYIWRTRYKTHARELV